jgi:cysteine desulfurase
VYSHRAPCGRHGREPAGRMHAGASPREIVFTSGATESNNLAVKGVAHFYKEKKRHIVTTQTEHKCVLDSCRVLQAQGFEVTYLPVDSEGLVSVDAVAAALRPDTALVSVMYVNNEIGVIQPVDEIGKLCREHKVRVHRVVVYTHGVHACVCTERRADSRFAQVFFHTDAAQAVGKIPVDVNAASIDLMSISGHKLYGPKGIGALYVRRRPRVRLEPQMSGGGQERGLRSGTVPTPLVVGLGAACELAAEARRPCSHFCPCSHVEPPDHSDGAAVRAGDSTCAP